MLVPPSTRLTTSVHEHFQKARSTYIKASRSIDRIHAQAVTQSGGVVDREDSKIDQDKMSHGEALTDQLADSTGVFRLANNPLPQSPSQVRSTVERQPSILIDLYDPRRRRWLPACHPAPSPSCRSPAQGGLPRDRYHSSTRCGFQAVTMRNRA